MKVVVVGAGIAGASAAFHLTQFGVEVYLVDSNAPGRATFGGRRNYLSVAFAEPGSALRDPRLRGGQILSGTGRQARGFG